MTVDLPCLTTYENEWTGLQQLWKTGCDFLGAPYAILGGAMTWVSERHLVSAISNAGGFGVIAAGAMTPDLLKIEIQETQKRTTKPFGVNLITMHPQLNLLIDVCKDMSVTHVVFAGGIPTSDQIHAVKQYGAKVIGFASGFTIAKKLLKMGVDALIIEGSEAGGHIGPVSTTVLTQEILPHIKSIPVFVAGGIGRGEAIVSYLRMGASGCQLGTRFVCAYESQVHPNFKQAFIRANARDAMTSFQLDPRFPVIPVRALVNKATQDFLNTQTQLIKKVDNEELTLKEAQLQIEHYWAGALRRAAIDGDIDNGSLMAGQSVGLVTREQSIHEIMNELLEQSLMALRGIV